ncbi:MAG: glycosyltransferase family 2 protein [Legionellales bacterium]|nr:glycosyltransferase family 2 protein [Legionellales bacterium]
MNNSTRSQQLANKTVFISALVPAHNEQAVIGDFLPALIASLEDLTHHFEIIVIDDGSKDDTLALARTFPIKILSFSRNFGKEIAITAGLEHAKGDVIIIIDCDFQHPLQYLPTFLQHWADGNDMVYGIRDNREHESYLKRKFTQAFYALMQKITQTQLPANAGDFRLLNRNVVNAINQCREYHRFMKGLYAWVGFKTIGIPYTAEERKAGQSSWHFRKLLELAITGITSFSSIPLRAWGIIGLIISAISFTYALFILIKTLLFGVDVPGFATITVAVMFFGGIQLLSIGILGEYIGRIFDEVKHRPKYFIDQKIGFEKNDTDYENE